jgi:hypothetical protein
MRSPSLGFWCSFPLVLLFAASTPARAAVIPLTAADLAGIPPITFAGIADGTVVNGLTVGGVLFSYLVNNAPSTNAVIDGGPGVTGNISPPNVVNTSNVGAVLRLSFAAPQSLLGYGFAVLAVGAVPNATTVSLFDASNALVGTLSANGVPDPAFPGGFLGLQSTVPFVRADLTFSPVAGAFAVDNIQAAAAVPEPATVALMAIGVVSASWGRRKRRP